MEESNLDSLKKEIEESPCCDMCAAILIGDEVIVGTCKYCIEALEKYDWDSS